MRFSVIIPAHNTAGYIGRAIKSVQAQTFKDYELIVVCDACSDGTEAEVRARGIVPLIIDESSPGAARNVGLDWADGEYILFLDSDDYFCTDQALELIDEQLQQAPLDVLHFGFFHGKVYAGVQGNRGNLWCNVWCRAWRRELIGDIRFNVELQTAEDYAFCCQVFQQPGILSSVLEAPLIQYTYPREGSLTWEAEYGNSNN